MGASSQGGRAAQGCCYRKECSLTRRDETRGTAPHRTAPHRHQTQGQHGLEWSARHLDKAGHAPSTDGASLHASIHTSHHTHHPARLNREAPPHPKPTLRPPEHAPWPREMPSSQPPSLPNPSTARQSNQINPSPFVEASQADKLMLMLMRTCKHSSSRRAHATGEHVYIHTVHPCIYTLREATCSTSRVIH